MKWQPKRALGVSVLVYLSTFIVYGLSAVLPWFQGDTMSVKSFLFSWVLYIPIILLFAKLYFKKLQPNIERGFYFGLSIIGVALVLDGLSILGAWAARQDLSQFQELYSTWMFYFTIVWVILLATYAGWEFDGTKSKDS